MRSGRRPDTVDAVLTGIETYGPSSEGQFYVIIKQVCVKMPKSNKNPWHLDILAHPNLFILYLVSVKCYIIKYNKSLFLSLFLWNYLPKGNNLG